MSSNPESGDPPSRRNCGSSWAAWLLGGVATCSLWAGTYPAEEDVVKDWWAHHTAEFWGFSLQPGLELEVGVQQR